MPLLGAAATAAKPSVPLTEERDPAADAAEKAKAAAAAMVAAAAAAVAASKGAPVLEPSTSTRAPLSSDRPLQIEIKRAERATVTASSAGSTGSGCTSLEDRRRDPVDTPRDGFAMPADVEQPVGKAAKKITLEHAFEQPEETRQPKGKGNLLLAATNPKIFIGNVPLGTSESTIRMECAKHGAVTSLQYSDDLGTAHVTFATPEMAQMALRRMRQQVLLFGAYEPLDILSADDLAARPVEDEDRNRPRRHSRSRRRRRSRSRGRRKVLAREDGGAHPTGAATAGRGGDDSSANAGAGPLSSPTTVPTVVSKRRGLRLFDSAQKRRADSPASCVADLAKPASEAAAAAVAAVEERPRQLAPARGNWAQWATAGGAIYYHHVRTGERTWIRPADFALAADAA